MLAHVARMMRSVLPPPKSQAFCENYLVDSTHLSQAAVAHRSMGVQDAGFERPEAMIVASFIMAHLLPPELQ